METGKSSFEMGQRSGFYTAICYEMLGSAIVTWAYNLGYKNTTLRAVAYLVGYLFAVNVSGAHFNPATSVAVYLTEKDQKQKNLRYLIVVIIMQLVGCYFGILVSFLLLRDYLSGPTSSYVDYAIDSYSLFPVPPSNTPKYNNAIYYYMDKTETEPSVYVMRVAMQEILQTFCFTFVFLAMRYDALFAKTSRVVKGLALFHVLWACYALTLGAGACLNPAFGMAQTTYWVGLGNTFDHLYDSSCIWIYMGMPFVGAILASVAFQYHRQVSEKYVIAKSD